MKFDYKRVLLKISGEALTGGTSSVHHQETVEKMANDVSRVVLGGTQVVLVIGGGNICRGATVAKMGVERSTADYMGMLSTVINALAFQCSLESLGISTRVLSAIHMPAVCEPYIRRRAMRHMEKGRVVICAAGIGNPYYTTDSCAVLRGAELNCEAIFKGTAVDGVYSSDPQLNHDASRYDFISYHDILSNDLKVMDQSAIALAKDTGIPIIVFNIFCEGGLYSVMNGEEKYTFVSRDTR